MASDAYEYNPIRGVRESGNNGEFIKVPPPNKFEWGLQDLSQEGAGRTEDNVMHKMRSGQLVKITLAWNNVRTPNAAAILQGFNPEYIEVMYLSPFHGKYVTATFYVGDRKSILFNSKRGVWEQISFAITEKEAPVKSV